jgi:hypothetical protein
MGPPREFICWLRDRTGAEIFVESGTFKGVTAEWAADQFREVITIELSPEIHRETSTRLAGKSNISFRRGHTAEVLSTLLPGMREPAIFWLDAHWSGLNTSGREEECPILAELRLLNDTTIEHSILIDDARLFTAPPPLPHQASQWPTIWQIHEALEQGPSPRFVIIQQDVIIAVPEHHRRDVVDFWQTWQPPRSSFAKDVFRAAAGRLRGRLARTRRRW